MRNLLGLFREVSASISKRGILKTIRLIRFELFKKKINIPEDDFDRVYNVETTKIVKTGELDTKSINWKYASAYRAMHSSYSLSEMLSFFEIDFSKYTFIDVGSGKGRVILMASMLPFNRIVGIEFSKSLIDIAEENLLKFPKNNQLCDDISFHLLDAAEYSFPKEEYILFMYNPFYEPVMEKVIENITKQFSYNPIHFIVIYLNPQFAYLFDEIDFLKEKETKYERNRVMVYEVRPEFLSTRVSKVLETDHIDVPIYSNSIVDSISSEN
jgi:hypothetical protein